MESTFDRLFSPAASVRAYGLGAIAFGLMGFIWGDFAVVWQPAPDSPPHPSELAYGVALLFFVVGLAIEWRRTSAAAVTALTILYSLGTIGLYIPRVVSHPSIFVTWESAAEQLALVAGGLIACGFSTRRSGLRAGYLISAGRLLFGVCLIIFGLAHLFYLEFTARMVPSWIPPSQLFWTYATAAGHFAAGLAFLANIARRAAALLLWLMFVAFGLLVHLPSVLTAPHSHDNWAENAINFGLIGTAWLLASLNGGSSSFDGRERSLATRDGARTSEA